MTSTWERIPDHPRFKATCCNNTHQPEGHRRGSLKTPGPVIPFHRSTAFFNTEPACVGLTSTLLLSLRVGCTGQKEPSSLALILTHFLSCIVSRRRGNAHTDTLWKARGRRSYHGKCQHQGLVFAR